MGALTRGKLFVLGLLALLVSIGGIVVWKANRRLNAILGPSAGAMVRVYSAPVVITPGVDVEEAELRARLVRLGYREQAEEPRAAGEFRRAQGRFEICLRGFRAPGQEQPPALVALELDGASVLRIVQVADGSELASVALEPESIGSYGTAEEEEGRHALSLDELPDHVVGAILAAEDARFAEHPGVDPIGIARAALVNLRHGAIEQGGSTITQQLVKNAMLSSDRTWSRKLEEALLALLIELRLSKREILETYLDTVYLGRVGSIGVHGIRQAARGMFDKDPADLGLGEAAVLAGIIRAPNFNSPLRHPERARERRDEVLAAMAEQGVISEEQRARAAAEPLETRRAEPLEAAFFVDQVLRELKDLGLADTGRTLSVYTTVDVEMQRAAEATVSSEIAALERAHPKLVRTDVPLEGAAVLLEVRTGFVRALVGGRDFARSRFNRATRARRQPGSAFKPFVYLAALDDQEHPITATTLVRDAPLRVRDGTRIWRPENSDHRFKGDVTVRRALTESRNIPAVLVADRVGIDQVTHLAAEAGLEGLPAVHSVALGTGEVSLLDLTAAYAVFPALGEVVRPTLILAVTGEDGVALYAAEPARRRVASEPAAFVMTHLLEGVVENGTARGVRKLGLEEPVAGKTGTTDDERDAWFVGFSPDLIAGVWIGFDDGRSLDLTASGAAVPMWVPLMQHALRPYGGRSFPVPPGVVFRDVDPRSGLLASAACPGGVHEAFVEGTEPTETCETGWMRSAAARARAQAESPLEKVGAWFRDVFGME